MQPQQNREEALLALALEKPVAERAAFLEILCGEDKTLRHRLEALLAAHGQPENPFPTQPDPTRRTIRLELPDEPVDDAAGQTVGRYKLLEKVGEGGCGVVYVADQIEPVRRRVALKVIKPGMDSKAVIARFEAERQALAMMDHPNIAKVLDAGTTGQGRPYFVMELVRGIKITDYCDQNHLSTRARLDLFIQVCQATQHAHQKGIIHRDIKPSNILVTLHDGAPVPKVIDFGIAKATEGRLTDATLYTQLHQFIGTPAYMSPEQAEMSGLDVDTRSDIYSLGVLLYELLTGRTPFDPKKFLEAGLDEIRRTIREVEPPRPSTRLSTLANGDLMTVARARGSEPPKLIHLIRGDLDWIVMKCLEKDRTRRYETANALARDLEHYLNHEPVTAVAPSAAYKLRKFVRRNRTAVIAASAITILLIAGVATSTWLAVLAMRARNNVTQANQQLKRQISETEKAREAETQQRRLTEEALQRMQTQNAEGLFGRGQAALAMAHLTQVLRANPSNEVAAARLVSALLHRPFRVPLIEPLRHESFVDSAQFSPDGQRIVTVSFKAAQVWDARTGRALTEPLIHEAPVRSAQFSPDGQRVLTASEDNTARVWDVRAGRTVTEPLRHEAPVQSAQFSPDGQRVVTASWDNTARVWDARTGQALTEPFRHQNRVLSAQFSPDGQRVVTASWDGTARLWDARTGQALAEPLRHELSVLFAQFSPDGQRVVTVTFKAAQVWDARTGQSLTKPLLHEDEVQSAQFSPDGQRLLTASSDRTAQVWDARTGQPLTEPFRHQSLVKSAQFSPDGQRVVTASWDGTARIWDAHTGQPLTEPLRHEFPVTCAQFSPDGQRVVTGCFDKLARVWEARTGQALAEPLRHEDQVWSAAFSPDGQRVVTASRDGTARVWDALTGQPLTEPLRHAAAVGSAQFSPDGQQVLTASADNTVRVWDARTGQSVIEPLRHEAWVLSAQFSPDGQRIVTASFDKTARVWDARTGRSLTEALRHEQIVWSGQFSPDGQRIVTASFDRTARVWDARTGQALGEPLRHQARLLSAQFSPDGQRVVTASEDQTARVWNARTGQAVTEPLRHEAPVMSARFSPDGQRVVTASADKTARVWNARTGQALTEPIRHEHEVTSAQFSPDGRRIVTASVDRTARVWDARTGQALSEPLRQEAAAASRYSFRDNDILVSAQFSPDGQRVATVCPDKTARVWEIAVAPVPVPEWFIEWTESSAGLRLNPQGIFTSVPMRDAHQRRKQAAARSDTDFYTRLAQWVQAEVSLRSISPFSPVTMSDYVNHRIQENTLASLREAVQLAPTNSLAFARLAMLTKDQTNSGHLDEAEFYARYALNQDTNNAVAWQSLAAIQCSKTDTSRALQSLERALELEPRSAPAWELKANILEQSDRSAESIAAYTRVVELVSAAADRAGRSRALLNRARVFRRLNQFREAGDDTCQAYGIPARSPNAAANLIDLSAYYNAALTTNWHEGAPSSDLSEVPRGIQTFAGVSFDVRGLIQVGAASPWGENYPTAVTNLVVGRACQRLHFLHSAINAFDAPDGTQIGSYVATYVNGRTHQMPIVIGRDVADWFTQPKEENQGFTIAWSGWNAESRRQGRMIRLFKSTWENPEPANTVRSVDLKLNLEAKSGQPFLVAITAE